MAQLKHIHFLRVGHCRQFQFLTGQSRSLKTCEFPALAVLMEHPTQGFVLFDTGYSEHFLSATRHVPEIFYRWLTPITLPREAFLLNQLRGMGIQADDIRTVVLSHLHADHIAGVLDFPNARFVCHQQAIAQLQSHSRFRNVLHGFLRELLPADFMMRAQACQDFPIGQSERHIGLSGYDIFQDGSCLIVELPGHAPGHIGMLVNNGQQEMLFAADACWHECNYKNLQYPNRLAYQIFDNKQAYNQTLHRLNELYHNGLEIYPSHCQASYARFLAKGATG